MKKSTLCVFTNSYPYGKGEAFVENELEFIAAQFETIYLFHKMKDSESKVVPENVKLIYIPPPSKRFKFKLFRSNLFLLVLFVIQEFFFSRQKKLFRKSIRYNVSHFLNCIYYSNEIELRLPSDVLKNAFFYSYWFFDWNLSLSILKHKRIININYTRTHGFDLYENTWKENYLPLRKFCLKNTNKIFPVSKTGESYLKELYPKYLEKIVLSYLGTKDFGLNPIVDNKDFLHIVSCSNINHVKRIHLIVELLKKMNSKIKWTHIGDGPLEHDIKSLIKLLPPNVTVDLKGRLCQSDIFDFYKSVPIDVFVNTSISEGLPVSIMEAISFGIPVIATNVGGTNEIVNDLTGFLITEPIDFEIIINYIDALKSDSEIVKKRHRIKDFWNCNFNADNNYNLFIKLF